MADFNAIDGGYTWSFDLSGGQPASERWIWEAARVHSLSRTEVLVRNRRTGAEVVMRQDVVNALYHCRRFRTLDGHVEAICQAMPALAGQRGSIRQVLGTLTRRGVLRAAGELLKELNPPSEVSAAASLELVFIRTSDRPPMLARLLDSLVDNQVCHGNSFRYVVVDDSRQEEARRSNASRVETLARSGTLDVRYYGATAQHRLRERLLIRWPGRTVLEWLLAGSGAAASYGLGWNHVLLLSAGQRFLLLDDDALCRAYAPPRAGQGLVMGAAAEGLQCYASRDAALAALEPLDLDPLARHADLLGWPLQAVPRSLGKPLNADSLDGLTPEDLLNLGSESPVLITANGVLGDPGLGSLHGLYLADGQARAQFTASETAYRGFLGGRHLWRGYESPCLLPDKALMTTTLTGFDNRRLMPPTLPEGRGEDQLFGGVLKLMYPNALRLQFPWSMPHLPEPQRRWDLSDLERPLRPRLAAFMHDLARQAADRCQAGSPRDRLTMLAALYADAAAAGETAFGTLLEEHRTYARSDLVRQLAVAMESFPAAPAYWREDMQRMIQANTRSSQPGEGYDAVGLAAARDSLGHYAEALSLWPELWDTCRDEGAALWKGTFP